MLSGHKEFQKAGNRGVQQRALSSALLAASDNASSRLSEARSHGDYIATAFVDDAWSVAPEISTWSAVRAASLAGAWRPAHQNLPSGWPCVRSSHTIIMDD